MRRKPLTGILTLGVAIALASALIGFAAFDLPFWAALLIYIVSGTAAILFIAWRRFRCVERHEMQAERGRTVQ
ncbi:hypothetical protein BDE18_0868 [Paracoccus pantotrophus]|uniref:Uncharacterized protein n=1 Tax=Paracoccus pantotrophus TaxID=82367 RepID=A0A1I5HED6_PARPN|nr:hypothetical protein ESD82_17710 [Paracoccus pantotrophus]QLH16449.1 hypothetical protein HYQ43_14870 [Paracoccus pantotrophus]RDD96435.1 hypothetical protein DTW92_12760 [Paracoccus pantotrophus]RKS51616.1 hypothetical protein BDE18_0868 [Paracoccus pantotrophus]RNI20230.1 hypothetical protein EB844_01220 [Paracoccus pantotrophus]